MRVFGIDPRVDRSVCVQRLAVAIPLLIVFFATACIKPPLPPAKIVPDCSVVPPNPLPMGNILQLNAKNVGGLFIVSGAVLPRNVAMNLTTDLSIVATGDIRIDGQINFPSGRATNVVLVSLRGNITIGPTGIIGSGFARPGRNFTASGVAPFAIGDFGDNGGYLKMVALEQSINIEGDVSGDNGGAGANVVASATRWQALLARFGLLAYSGSYQPGSATAYGGQSGAGGDVILCAQESIHVGSAVPAGAHVRAGDSSKSGDATATSALGALAVATASSITLGHGSGGDVIVSSTAPGIVQLPVFIDVNSGINGGNGAKGGSADATAEGGPGFANAQGGTGEAGGNVIYISTVVFDANVKAGRPPGTSSGNGGDGGPADALGGPGPAGGKGGDGGKGGSALARGGSGAPPGLPPPVFLYGYVTPWVNLGGRLGSTGSGNSASAQPGNGGPAGTGGKSGGSSGTGVAIGGSNGAGRLPPPPVPGGPSGPVVSGPQPPNPATPTQGGQGQKGTQLGAP
jgi:hypothetical protein